MKKFLGMLLLAGAVAVAATSCDKDEDPDNRDIVQGSYDVTIVVTKANTDTAVAFPVGATLTVEKSGSSNLKLKGDFNVLGQVPVVFDLELSQLSYRVNDGTKGFGFKVAQQNITVGTEQVPFTGKDVTDGYSGVAYAEGGKQYLSLLVTGTVAPLGAIDIYVASTSLLEEE